MINAKHIVILCSRLDLPGGIEKAIIQLANTLSKKGYNITLFILDNTKETFYPLEKAVDIIQHPLNFGITKKGNVFTRKISFLKDITRLKKEVRKSDPDIVLSTEYPFAIAAVVAGLHKEYKLVSWEHHHLFELKKSGFWQRLFLRTYPKLHAVVCLNPDEQKLYSQFNEHTTVVPNFILPANGSRSADSKTILTVGRLTHVKGTDLLLKAAAVVLSRFPEWKWKIIGDGDMRIKAETFIKEKRLEKSMTISPPFTNDLSAEYSAASIYVSASRNESFGLTIAEAMAAGTPCISFDCETGPRHIIVNEDNGLLVKKENPEKLAEAIEKLITNEELRRCLSEKASETIKQFHPDNILPEWEKLFLKLLA